LKELAFTAVRWVSKTVKARVSKYLYFSNYCFISFVDPWPFLASTGP
jgi:hypothetical protein